MYAFFNTCIHTRYIQLTCIHLSRSTLFFTLFRCVFFLLFVTCRNAIFDCMFAINDHRFLRKHSFMYMETNQTAWTVWVWRACSCRCSALFFSSACFFISLLFWAFFNIYGTTDSNWINESKCATTKRKKDNDYDKTSINAVHCVLCMFRICLYLFHFSHLPLAWRWPNKLVHH